MMNYDPDSRCERQTNEGMQGRERGKDWIEISLKILEGSPFKYSRKMYVISCGHDVFSQPHTSH